ncbi:TOMM precursor leader peptide-binding protein [Demetria terragena]|uniref:TOMM precursor leader peptide-binding protein n=1 Tax=Demetria terragena TaxID=63959 RepID=UPI0004783BC7|nr:TOMM precursor leader peptide-binding protein [Demetria terragena]
MTSSHPVIPLRTTRSDSTLLVRLPRAPGMLVEGVHDSPARILLGLGATSTLELRALAKHHRTPEAVANILGRLAQAAEESASRHRQLDHVVVTGGGTIAAGLLTLLDGYAATVTPPELADPALIPDHGPLDLVIAVTHEALDLDRCREWLARGVPVLPVVARGDLVVIGPIFMTGCSPCPQCVEMHRHDRDPRRGQLLLSPDPGLHDPEQLQVEPAQNALALGLVATLVRCLAQGIPLPRALSLTVRLPYPEVGHHEWTTHPRCQRCAPQPPSEGRLGGEPKPVPAKG